MGRTSTTETTAHARRAGRAIALVVAALVLAGGCGASGSNDSATATSAPDASSTTAVPESSAPEVTAESEPATTTAPPTTTEAHTTTTAPPTTTEAPTTTTAPLPPPTAAPPLPLPPDAVAACGPPEGTWFVTTYTTARHVVHICEPMGQGQTWYRGRNLQTGDSIDLPAEYGDLGIYANNGNTQYYVNGDVLTVHRGDELILEEDVLSIE